MSECKARASVADPPQDCDWPFCGCDPMADKVLEAIQECDLTLVPVSTLDKLTTALRMGLQLGESGKHGGGDSCPTCHFVREARKAIQLFEAGR